MDIHYSTDSTTDWTKHLIGLEHLTADWTRAFNN